jgi:hypothetical protein
MLFFGQQAPMGNGIPRVTALALMTAININDSAIYIIDEKDRNVIVNVTGTLINFCIRSIGGIYDEAEYEKIRNLEICGRRDTGLPCGSGNSHSPAYMECGGGTV